MSLFGCRITGVAMSVFAWMSYHRGCHECLHLHVVLQRWSSVYLLGCRITECLFLDPELQRWS